MAGQDTLEPDLCVVGGGTAGSALALAAAGLGLACVLVERRLPLGRGAFADIVADELIAAGGGDFAGLRGRIGRRVARAAPAVSVERLRAAGVRVLEASGRFADPVTLSAGPFTVRARRFALATGARPAVPAVPGLEVVRYRTPDALGGLAHLPERLVVIGADPRAAELAQAFRRLGSAVTLVGGPPPVDPELWGHAEAALRRDGVDLRPGPVLRVEPRGTGAAVTLGGDRPGTVEASDLLVADGAAPVTGGLGLSRAGIARAADGGLVLRADLRTGNRRVFALGDVLGPLAAGPAGLPVQVGTVLRAGFLRQPVRYAPDRVARVLRTVPPLAETGLGEAEARRRHRMAGVFRAPLADAERGFGAADAPGHLKVVTGAGGRVLGAGIVGPRAEDLLGPWVLAVSAGLTLGAVATAPFAQPSLSDASRRAALAYLTARLRSPFVKRLMAVVRRLG